MERMPTSNMTGCNTLHGLHLPVSTFLGFALRVDKTQFPEQGLRLLGIQLQRYVTSLHTSSSTLLVGFKEQLH
jgi:hypothetical protein